jgi:hypothetical protein
VLGFAGDPVLLQQALVVDVVAARADLGVVVDPPAQPVDLAHATAFDLAAGLPDHLLARLHRRVAGAVGLHADDRHRPGLLDLDALDAGQHGARGDVVGGVGVVGAGVGAACQQHAEEQGGKVALHGRALLPGE